MIEIYGVQSYISRYVVRKSRCKLCRKNDDTGCTVNQDTVAKLEYWQNVEEREAELGN